MKAVRYYEQGPPEVMKLEDFPMPTPQADEALVRINAAAANYAQTLQRSGRYPLPLTLPHMPGSSVAGVIERVGEGADPGLVGKRVYGQVTSGGYAEYGVGPATGFVELPETLSEAEAVAMLSDGAIAYLVLTLGAELKPGQTIFVPAAAGGIGYIALQLAKVMGAGKVFGAAGSPERRQIVLDLGADAAIDYTEANWSKQVIEANDGRGVDLALEMTGGPIFYETIEAVRPGGRIVNYGNVTNTDSPINPRVLLRKNLTLRGFSGAPFHHERDMARDEVLKLLVAGKLKTQYQTYPLADVITAHHDLEARNTAGRPVLLPHG
jgi:NADPH2:quinone reductase